MTSKGERIFPWSSYDHMRLKGSLPDAFAVAEVPKHEIRSPHDWLFRCSRLESLAEAI